MFLNFAIFIPVSCWIEHKKHIHYQLFKSLKFTNRKKNDRHDMKYEQKWHRNIKTKYMACINQLNIIKRYTVIQ